MRVAWAIVMACACAASHPHATKKQGHVSVATSVDPKLPRSGTLFTYWMTKDEVVLATSGSKDLTPPARLLDRLQVVGEVSRCRR